MEDDELLTYKLRLLRTKTASYLKLKAQGESFWKIVQKVKEDYPGWTIVRFKKITKKTT